MPVLPSETTDGSPQLNCFSKFKFKLFSYTVRTTRPEKCEVFAHHYQSQPIFIKLKKIPLIFSLPSETMSKYFSLGIVCIMFKMLSTVKNKF